MLHTLCLQNDLKLFLLNFNRVSLKTEVVIYQDFELIKM